MFNIISPLIKVKKYRAELYLFNCITLYYRHMVDKGGRERREWSCPPRLR